MDYDLDIILIAHFADRVRGASPPPLGEFAQNLFDLVDREIAARIPGLDHRQRSVIAALAFLTPAPTVEQTINLALEEFTTLNR